MKAGIVSLIAALLFISDIGAQAPEDSAVYNPGILLIAGARTQDEYIRAARYFEQLSTRQPEHWVALYYTGLSYIHASRQAKEGDTKDALLDKVQPLIDKAFEQRPGEPEIFVLQAFLYQSRIEVMPELRGLTYSQKADASLKKALAKDPDNPRAYMLMGYNVYFTPSLFGGGAKHALPLFLKAQEKYLTYKPGLPYYPNWGESENKQMIKACYQNNN